MDHRGLGGLLDYLRSHGADPEVTSDGELLRRYSCSKDQAAFELLVRRHGPMVHGVARRVLRDVHAADDVYQATFLALARRSGVLKANPTVAGWLYRVARNVAIRARAKPQPANSESRPTVDPAAAAEWSELRTILDEEVDRLPDRFRMAVVLCYLSGRSTEEAARELGCPRGTILSRLAAARDRLRVRLARRGFAVPVATLAAGLAGEQALVHSAGPPVALALKVTGPAALAPAIVALAEGGLKVMLVTKLKVALSLAVAGGLLGAGVLRFTGPGEAAAVTLSQQPDPPTVTNQPKQAPVEPADPSLVKLPDFGLDPRATPNDGPDVKLTKEKYQSASRELALRFQEFHTGRGYLDSLFDAARRLRDAGTELATTRDERERVLTGFQAVATAIYDLNKLRYERGAIKQQDLEVAYYEKLDAELRLLRLRQPGGAR